MKILILICAFFLSACSSVIQPISSSKATLDYQSNITEMLRSLPPPVQPIVVAVYKFRDQTGQYKSSDTIQYSTAVSQGGSSMLIRALLEAGNGKWFRVLERENLTDLMNERKIIHQTRKMYANGNNPANTSAGLPPLLYAPILLEGGIIAYESNLLTGGLGAYYFGLGGSTKYQRDTVTTMLRAVSVKSGEILNNVDARKTIFSIQLDSGLFRYVAFKRLLELEAGVTSNEPPQMAVMEAIEANVYAMIMEGLINNLWTTADKSKIKPIIEAYLAERDSEMVAEFDKNGRVVSIN